MDKRRIIQIMVITLLCGGVYVGVRNIPVAQCGFLHYEEVVLENGEVELCATNEAGFVNLEQLEPPVLIDILGMKDAQAGQEVRGTLRLKMLSGVSLYAQDLAVTHTRKLHLLIIDESLEDYHHVHPQPIEGSDLWEFAWTPAHGGPYHVFADFVPVRTRRQVITRAVVEVAGEAPAVQPNWGAQREEGDLVLCLRGDGEAWQTQLSQDVALTVTDPAGKAVQLEEIMGAFAHIVVFDEKLQGIGHMHPIPNGKETLAEPELAFSFYTQEIGRYRLWAHLQWGGQERYVPFDLMVN